MKFVRWFQCMVQQKTIIFFFNRYMSNLGANRDDQVQLQEVQVVQKSKDALHSLLSLAVCLLPTLLEQTFLPAPTHVCLPCGRKYLSAFAVWLLLKRKHFLRGLTSALKLIKESRRTECFVFLDFKRNVQVRPHYEKREQEKRNKKNNFLCSSKAEQCCAQYIHVHLIPFL